MRVAKVVFLIVAVALAAVWCAACEPEEEKEPSVSEWIARGKTLLGEGNGTGAYVAFQEALKQDRGNLQGRYGVVLADVLQFGDTIELLTTLLTTPPTDISAGDTSLLCQKLDECGVLDVVQIGYPECVTSRNFGLEDDAVACVLAAPTCEVMFSRCGLSLPASDELCTEACAKMDDCGLLTEGGWSEAQCKEHCPQLYLAGELECLLQLGGCDAAAETCFPSLGSSIQEFLTDFWDKISLEMANSLAKVQAQPENFSFEIKKFNFSLLDLPWQPSLSGRHDLTDTFFFSSIYSGMDALFSSALALDINFNPTLLMMLQTDLDLSINFDDLGPEDIEKIIAVLQWIDEVIDVILNDPIYSTFLTLREPDGAETFQRVGLQVGMMFGSLAEMIEEVKAEGADPDDPIGFLDENGDGQWNAPEPLIIPGVTQMEYDLAWAVHDLLLALKIDFVDGYAFRFDSLGPLFSYFDLAWINTLLEGLDLLGIDRIDLGAAFREPDPQGVRPLLADVQTVVEELIDLLSSAI